MVSSEDQAGELEKLARARFGNLSHGELALLRAAPRGKLAPCGESCDTYDPTNDPARAEAWGQQREVRAELIRWLCTDLDAAARVDPRGLQLLGAAVVGELDLSFVKVPFPL